MRASEHRARNELGAERDGSQLFRRLGLALVVGLIVFLLPGVQSSAAPRAVGHRARPGEAPPCAINTVCAWRDADSRGPHTFWYVGDSDPDFRHQSYRVGGGPLNDSISSIYNPTDRNIYFYADSRYRGAIYVIGPHYIFSALGGRNDTFTSMSANGDLS